MATAYPFTRGGPESSVLIREIDLWGFPEAEEPTIEESLRLTRLEHIQNRSYLIEVWNNTKGFGLPERGRVNASLEKDCLLVSGQTGKRQILYNFCVLPEAVATF